MQTLPKDMLLELLSKVDDSEIFQLCQVDRRFYQVCKNEEFWKNRGAKNFGPEFMQLHNELKNSSFKKTYRIALDLLFLKTWLSQLKQKVEIKSIIDLFHVRELYLYDNQLKEIPKEIGNLHSLEQLSLAENQLKEIPKELGNLHSLQYLYLSKNQLKEIPKEIGNLRSLQELSLYDNQLKEIPKEIGNLHSLEQLSLYENQLKEIPKELGKLRSLRELYLDKITNVPKEIRNIPNITIGNRP